MAAAYKGPRWSRTTSDTVSGAELGIQPLETNIEKPEMAIQRKEHAKNKLPAIVDRAVGEKVQSS